MKKSREVFFDVVVLGGGSAGFTAAEVAKRQGARVCIVEAERLGGECPTVACVPTKAMLYAAKLYDEATRDFGRYGVRAHGVHMDFRAIMRRKDAVVSALTGGGKRLSAVARRFGIPVFSGAAAFVDAHSIAAGDVVIGGRAFVVATGAVDVVPRVAGLLSINALSYRDIMELTALPRSLVIIGGGPVGVEFATFFGTLGTRVTLIETDVHILPREDDEVALLAERALMERGVVVRTGSRVLGVKKVKREIVVTYAEGKRPRRSVSVTHVLVASGRVPNVAHLGLHGAGVAVDAQGKIVLDEYLRTSAGHIFLAGDCAGGSQFTHVAHHEGAIAGYNAWRVAASKGRKAPAFLAMDASVIPRVTFGFPEIASVGLTAASAKKAGIAFAVGKVALAGLGRAAIDGRREGMLKILVEKKSGRIVGAHMIGERAGEVIHELALAMSAGVPAATLERTIHAFPTYSEAIPAALASLS